MKPCLGQARFAAALICGAVWWLARCGRVALLGEKVFSLGWGEPALGVEFC